MTPPARLREAHAHIAQHGRAMSMIPLGGCRSAADLLQAVRRQADAGADPGAWILGVGMRSEGWSDPTPPGLDQFDDAARGRPCFLWSFDHHAALASSAALAAAGISRGTPDPPHGRIVRDPRSGRPSGLVLEAAAKLVWERAPEPSPGERREQVRRALADFARHGFVEVHDLHAPVWLGPVLAELDDAGELPISTLLYPPLASLEEVAAAARAPGGWERPRVRLGGGKLFADGTLNSRTAWMLEPYADPLPGMERGEPMVTAADLDDAIRRTGRLGLGLAVHAIGDAAVRAVLDAAERGGTAPRNGAEGPGAGRGDGEPLHRIRIEHAELIDEADVPRFARLGVVASVQPCHLLADVEALRRGLPHRLGRVLPLRDLIDAGCRPGDLLLFGSDAPIVRPHPEDSILAATARRRDDMGPAGAIAPEQAISSEEAWAAFSCPARGRGS